MSATPLYLFGWLIPDWLQIVATVGFFAFWAGLILYTVGLSLCWWGPGEDTFVKYLKRERARERTEGIEKQP